MAGELPLQPDPAQEAPMTVFDTPLGMLPNGGIVRRPDLAAVEHQAALAGIADKGARRRRPIRPGAGPGMRRAAGA